MGDKTTFPISTGLLCQKHRDAISSAIWEFLWLIDRTTREETDDRGCTWGVVLGGKPIKADEIANAFMTHPETIKKNLRRLESGGYIRTTRTRYGLVVYVRKSIKFAYRQPKRQEKKIPTNQQIIAELVDKYRQLPGIKEQKGDYPFIGRCYNESGYDQVLEAINSLGYQLDMGFIPDNPLLYLKGILKRGDGDGASGRYSSTTGKPYRAKSAANRPGQRPSSENWEQEGDSI